MMCISITQPQTHEVGSPPTNKAQMAAVMTSANDEECMAEAVNW